jgi:hypothetical protein
MTNQKINHAAVWLSVLVFQLLGALWYSPLLFAGTWMDYLGKTFNDFQGESPTGLVFSLMMAVAFNYFMAWLCRRLQITNGVNGLMLGLAIGICCFVLPTCMQDAFSLRPFGLSMINGGIVLLDAGFSGLLLGSWRKYSTTPTT